MADVGTLAVVSGFSGVGKGTVMKKMIEMSDRYALSVSATTRAPREGEIHGKEYFFLSEQAFIELIEKDELIEYACYCGNYYGTPRKFVEEKLLSGSDVILEIEIQGARKVRERFPEALLIFIMPPSGAELIRRLAGRGTENEQVIHDRISRAAREAEGIEDYDYIFVNDDADECAAQIDALIQSNRHRVRVNSEFIEKIRGEIQLLQNMNSY